MFKQWKGFLAGVVLTAFVMGSIAVFAGDISKTVDVIYSNIKIFIDGAEYVAKDANGNVVEPFIYNGTTYLPVRGIANAFGKDVVWDGANASIFLGKTGQNQPDNYLDRIQYTDFMKGYGDNNLWKINGKITDSLKNDYTNGMLFYTQWYGYAIKDDKDEANILIDYPLNSQYKNISGKIVLPTSVDIAGKKENEINNGDVTCDVYFYGDGKLLHTAKSVTKTMAFNFNFDVKGVNTLTVKLKTSDDTYVALTDLALYK